MNPNHRFATPTKQTFKSNFTEEYSCLLTYFDDLFLFRASPLPPLTRGKKTSVWEGRENENDAYFILER